MAFPSSLQRWSADDVARLKCDYATTPIRDLMSAFNRSRKSVLMKAFNLGLEKIGHPGYIYPESRRRYPVAARFLAPITNETAYLVGLVLADGCIHSNGRFSISSKYAEYLRLVLDRCELTNPIERYVKNGLHVTYKVTVCSKDATDKLRILGLTERKSLTATLPTVPSDMFNHMLRGYFDGDGHIGNSSNGFRVKFTSGSRQLLLDVGDAVNSKLGIKGSTVVHDKGRPNANRLFYHGQPAFRLCEYMYQNANGVLLDYKHDVFLQARHRWD